MNIGSYFNHGKQSLLYRLQMRTSKIRKFIGNYLYYRNRNHTHKMAWRMARDTL